MWFWTSPDGGSTEFKDHNEFKFNPYQSYKCTNGSKLPTLHYPPLSSNPYILVKKLFSFCQYSWSLISNSLRAENYLIIKICLSQISSLHIASLRKPLYLSPFFPLRAYSQSPNATNGVNMCWWPPLSDIGNNTGLSGGDRDSCGARLAQSSNKYNRLRYHKRDNGCRSAWWLLWAKSLCRNRWTKSSLIGGPHLDIKYARAKVDPRLYRARFLNPSVDF